MSVNDGSTGSAKTKKYIVFSVNNDNVPLFVLSSEPKNNARIYFDTCITFALIFEEEEKGDVSTKKQEASTAEPMVVHYKLSHE